MAGIGKKVEGAAKRAAKGKGTGGKKSKGSVGSGGAAKAKNVAKKVL